MHDSVAQNYVTYTSPIEGVFPYLYPDVKGLLTTAIGDLADGIERALAMPWRLPNGELASENQVRAEWLALKARPELSRYLASNHVVESATTIRLHAEDILALVKKQLLANEARMRRFFARWDDYPADAQLALLSLAWALGSDFELGYPKLTAAANAGDWEACAAECHIDERGNPGVIVRNAQTVLLFHNARAVSEHHLDPETLYWPAPAPTVSPDIHSAAAVGLSLAPYPTIHMALELGAFAYPVESDTGHSGKNISEEEEAP